MRLAIISDIHGNREALSKTLEDIRSRGADEIVCLGDIVGYGPDPEECLAIVRDLKIPSLMGNHDAATYDLEVRSTFSPLARTAMEWTSGRLDTSMTEHLRALPLVLERHGVTFVHAAPVDPQEFNYILDESDAADNFAGFSSPLCFVGHTHHPAVFCEDFTSRRVTRGVRAIVNVGSVGQPRDGDQRACYGLFDTSSWAFEHIRVPYPVEITAEKIYAAGLPRQLGERLVFGI
jgi:diadenosine tetraphosphatase ApaH/serine/threonine PP2A family protein phosphatase